MSSTFLVFICLIFLNGCKSEMASTYTAAVVEVNPISGGTTDKSVFEITKQAIGIIESSELKGVDIVVLPEAIFNRQNTAVLLPRTNTSYCDDRTVDPVLRNVSCAAQKANIYVVIDLYVKVKCSLDDQKYCVNQTDSTNLYNMAIVFNRNGEVVAKYRKYHLFNEIGVQQTRRPDLTTFRTDFNVTFGVCVCFDLMFDEPVNLVERGIKHFVYPTMWFSEIPYLTAVQYQQSWAYANNVNLLAANVNAPSLRCTGSGIFAGRLGALNVFVSETPATRILIAKVPIEPKPDEHNYPKSDKGSREKRLNIRSVSNPETERKGSIFGNFAEKFLNFFTSNIKPEDLPYKIKLSKGNLTEFTVNFLNFTENSTQIGTVCNKAICCNYTVEVSDSGEVEGKSSYSYAISVFSGHRHYKTVKNILTGQEVCSLIACTTMNTKSSCGIRTPLSQVHNRYNFKQLSLQTLLPVTYMKVMPNTLTGDLLPLNTTEFQYNISQIKDNNKDNYMVELNLNAPKSNLLTFAIFSRNYDKDMIKNSAGSKRGVITFVTCFLLSISWMRYNSYVIH